jgi:hypothetical protein
MTRGSPSKTPVVHQINFHKLNEINRESALAAGTKDWAPVHSVTVGGVDIDLQVSFLPFSPQLTILFVHLDAILCSQKQRRLRKGWN